MVNFRENKLNLGEKIRKVIADNLTIHPANRESSMNLEETIFEPFRENCYVLTYETSGYSSFHLSNAFRYIGLDSKQFIQEVNVGCVNDSFMPGVRVTVWFKKEKDCKDCKHSYVWRNKWGSAICEVCGHFSSMKKEKKVK